METWGTVASITSGQKVPPLPGRRASWALSPQPSPAQGRPPQGPPHLGPRASAALLLLGDFAWSECPLGAAGTRRSSGLGAASGSSGFLFSLSLSSLPSPRMSSTCQGPAVSSQLSSPRTHPRPPGERTCRALSALRHHPGPVRTRAVPILFPELLTGSAVSSLGHAEGLTRHTGRAGHLGLAEPGGHSDLSTLSGMPRLAH